MGRQKGRDKSWIGKRGTVKGGIDKRGRVKDGGKRGEVEEMKVGKGRERGGQGLTVGKGDGLRSEKGKG